MADDNDLFGKIADDDMENDSRLSVRNPVASWMRLLDLSGQGRLDITRFEELINEFTIYPIEDSLKPLPDLSDDIHAAETLLKTPISTANTQGNLAYSAIEALGRRKVSERLQGIEEEKDRLQTSMRMARALVASGETVNDCISLSAVCNDGNMRFVLGADGMDSETLESVVRGVYGQASVSKSSAPSRYEHCYAATLSLIGRRKESLKNKEEEDKPAFSWLSEIFDARADGNFSVTAHISRISDAKDLIAKRIAALSEHYRHLMYYAKINVNSAMNAGISTQRMLPMPSRIMNKFKNILQTKEETSQENAGSSVSLNAAHENKALVALLDDVEYEITRLKEASHSAAWDVCVTVSAEKSETADALTTLIEGALTNANIYMSWTKGNIGHSLLCGVNEILPLAMFPVREFENLAFLENDEFALSAPTIKEGDSAIRLGGIMMNGREIAPFSMPDSVFNRHGFICGMTGSGKTNTLFRLIEQSTVPFMVIEPVKGEYRALRGKYPDLHIWTMDTAAKRGENMSLMRINPFWFPRESSLSFHIDSIKTILSSAFEMEAAMPNIIEQCLTNIYIRCGWNPVTNRNIYMDKLPNQYLYPTFTDLCGELETYLDNSEFDGEVKSNYKGALLSRMRSFVNGSKGILLNSTDHPDYAMMAGGRNIIELEGLADDADKCLVMGTILIQYFEYIKRHFHELRTKATLKSLMIIEEAHRLFKALPEHGEGKGGANPTGQLVDMLGNIMAEIRAFGVGMLIVDQSPTKIANDVIKNSSTKIVHRIDNAEDIKCLQSALLLGDDRTSLPSLAQGETLVRTDGMTRPCKVRVALSTIKDGYSLSDSYASSSEIDADTENMFTATGILLNDEVYSDIREATLKLVFSMLLLNPDGYMDAYKGYMFDIIEILKKHEMYDRVDRRFAVIRTIVTIVARRAFAYKSLAKQSYLHMGITRMVDICRETSIGKFHKPREFEMLKAYAHMRMENAMDGGVYSDYPESLIRLCEIERLNIEGPVPQLISTFIDDSRIVMKDAETDKLSFEPAALFLKTRAYGSTENLPQNINDYIVNAINKTA